MRRQKDKFLGYIDEWIDKPKDERTFWDHFTDIALLLLLVLMAVAVWWVRNAPAAGLWPFN